MWNPTFLDLPLDISLNYFYFDVSLRSKLARLNKRSYERTRHPRVLEKLEEEPVTQKEKFSFIRDKILAGNSVELNSSLNNSVLAEKFAAVQLPPPIMCTVTLNSKKQEMTLVDIDFIYSMNRSIYGWGHWESSSTQRQLLLNILTVDDAVTYLLDLGIDQLGLRDTYLLYQRRRLGKGHARFNLLVKFNCDSSTLLEFATNGSFHLVEDRYRPFRKYFNKQVEELDVLQHSWTLFKFLSGSNSPSEKWDRRARNAIHNMEIALRGFSG